MFRKHPYFVAAIIAIILALPFMAVGSWFLWQSHVAYGLDHQIAGMVGAMAVYSLGLPLTFFAAFLIPEDIHAISSAQTTGLFMAANGLFLFQWLIWSRLIVVVWKRLKGVRLN